MRILLATVGLAATAVGFTAGATPAVAAPADTISVAYRTTQTLEGVDPHRAAVAVTVSASDCSRRCDLYRVGRLRLHEEAVLVGSRTFPAQSTPRRFTLPDVLSTPPGRSLDWHYELRDAGGQARAAVDADVRAVPESAARLSAGWTRQIDLAATETVVVRSTTPGATATFAPADAPRRVGVIAPRGPRAGVMVVKVGGAVRSTVDLRAASWTPRQVVASVEVPAGAAVQVVNATPAGRAAKEVHLDGLLETGGALAATGSGAAQQDAARTSGAAAVPAAESVSVLPAVQQLSAGPGPVGLTVTAQVYGCPEGCRLVQTSDVGGEEVLLEVTSPASSTLRTLTTTTDATSGFSVRLEKGSRSVARTPYSEPVRLGESAFTFSDGFSADSSAIATDGTIMRSSAAGAGATYRAPGTFDGRPVGLVAARGPRNGVAAIYVDGRLVQTVDLQAPTYQPRSVVASVQLPLTGRLTVVNRTPADRAAKDVHVDGLVLVDAPDDWY